MINEEDDEWEGGLVDRPQRSARRDFATKSIAQQNNKTCVMYGFYYHVNNLRFKQTQHFNDYPAAHVVVSRVSSE